MRTVLPAMRTVLVLTIALVVGAVPAVLAVDTSTSIANVAPVVASASLSGVVSGALSPTAGTTTATTVTIAVTDDNGYQDISSVAVTVKKPDGTTHVASSAATFASGSLLTGTYTYSFTMSFHDAPALSTSTYKVDVVATDSQGATSGLTGVAIAAFNYNELAALASGASVSLGSDLTPGATTAAQALSVTNQGNVAIDVQLSGTALSHGSESASIAVGNMKWNYTADMASGTAMTTTAATASAFDLATGASSSKSLYFQLTVPSGDDQWVPSGTYSGTLTVGAVKG